MSEEANYSRRELEHYFKDMKDDVAEIKTQTQKTNGRVNKMEMRLYIIGAVVATLLITSGSQLLAFIKGII
jgi:hypothetical protein